MTRNQTIKAEEAARCRNLSDAELAELAKGHIGFRVCAARFEVARRRAAARQAPVPVERPRLGILALKRD